MIIFLQLEWYNDSWLPPGGALTLRTNESAWKQWAVGATRGSSGAGTQTQQNHEQNSFSTLISLILFDLMKTWEPSLDAVCDLRQQRAPESCVPSRCSWFLWFCIISSINFWLDSDLLALNWSTGSDMGWSLLYKPHYWLSLCSNNQFSWFQNQ